MKRHPKHVALRHRPALLLASCWALAAFVAEWIIAVDLALGRTGWQHLLWCLAVAGHAFGWGWLAGRLGWTGTRRPTWPATLATAVGVPLALLASMTIHRHVLALWSGASASLPAPEALWAELIEGVRLTYWIAVPLGLAVCLCARWLVRARRAHDAAAGAEELAR